MLTENDVIELDELLATSLGLFELGDTSFRLS